MKNRGVNKICQNTNKCLTLILTRTNVCNMIEMVKGVREMKNSETIKNVAGIIVFYLVLILGVIAIDARMEVVNSNQNIASLRD